MATDDLRIRSLAAMARALGRSEPLLAHLELAAEESRTAMRAASVSLSRLVPGSLVVQTLINVGDLGPGEERWPDDETYAIDEFANLSLTADELPTWTYERHDPDITENEAILLDHLGKGSSLGAPLIVDGRLWGEFYATRHLGEAGFDDVDTDYLEAMLAILSGAISRSLREESLEQLAYHDPLTGLLNRRALDEYAEKAFVLADTERTLTAVTLDINRLKEVNDTLGHVAGDQLIQAVARDLTTRFNTLPSALVARVGGDEFTVLVSEAEPSVVLAVADTLCRTTWRFGPGAGVSAGAATVTLARGATISPADLFAAADRAQYVAKHGRLSTTVLSTEFDPVLD